MELAPSGNVRSVFTAEQAVLREASTKGSEGAGFTAE